MPPDGLVLGAACGEGCLCFMLCLLGKLVPGAELAELLLGLVVGSLSTGERGICERSPLAAGRGAAAGAVVALAGAKFKVEEFQLVFDAGLVVDEFELLLGVLGVLPGFVQGGECLHEFLGSAYGEFEFLLGGGGGV